MGKGEKGVCGVYVVEGGICKKDSNLFQQERNNASNWGGEKSPEIVGKMLLRNTEFKCQKKQLKELKESISGKKTLPVSVVVTNPVVPFDYLKQVH